MYFLPSDAVNDLELWEHVSLSSLMETRSTPEESFTRWRDVSSSHLDNIVGPETAKFDESQVHRLALLELQESGAVGGKQLRGRIDLIDNRAAYVEGGIGRAILR